MLPLAIPTCISTDLCSGTPEHTPHSSFKIMPCAFKAPVPGTEGRFQSYPNELVRRTITPLLLAFPAKSLLLPQPQCLCWCDGCQPSASRALGSHAKGMVEYASWQEALGWEPRGGALPQACGRRREALGQPRVSLPPPAVDFALCLCLMGLQLL